MFYVQDYVRVTGSDDGDASGSFFYTYNESIEHPYFVSRPGFVRFKMKYQGMVGVMGGGGKTRLTWFVNMDFGGLLPSAFTNGLLVALMHLPRQIVDDTKEYVNNKKGEATDAVTTAAVAEGVVEQAQGLDGIAHLPEDARSLIIQLQVTLRAKEEEFKTVLTKKQEELAEKQEEIERQAAELSEMRKRIPRVHEGDY